MMAFDSHAFLPASIVARITEVRVDNPDRALQVAAQRRRRAALTGDGKLTLLAADHPARRATAVGDDPLAMADRRDLLARVVRVLSSDAVDGVLATMDLLEELLILHDLIRQAGGPSLLDDKVLIPSLNRGGLAGVCWEIDDPITGPSPTACARTGMDGVKLLLRVCDDDPGSLATLRACAQAITEANAHALPTFLEPLAVTRSEAGYQVVQDAAALARLVGVAAALGDSSRHLWLKLPYCDDFGTVARATTLPILLLGGYAAGDAAPFLTQLATAIAAAPNVRGAMVGRNVLYPGEADPAAVAVAVNRIVREGWTADRAHAAIRQHEPERLDAVTRWLPDSV